MEKGVIVTGMRRSGTSLTANILRNMGVSFHDDARPADKANEEGYWESHNSELLNERILAYLGGDQDRPPPTPRDWEKGKRIQKLLGDCKSFVSELQSNVCWGWKDTRLCITLPLWKDLLPKRMRYLLCVRNPLEVARSWNKMDGKIDISRASAMWFIFTANAIKNTANENTLLVFFHDYFSQPQRQISDIANFVGASENTSALSSAAPNLRHQEVPLEELLANSEVLDEAKVLYSTMLLCKSDPRTLHHLQDKFSNYSKGLSPWHHRFISRLRYYASFDEGWIVKRILRGILT